MKIKNENCRAQLVSVIVMAMFTLQLGAQTLPGKLINSWFGNSNATTEDYVPQGIEGMFVSPDGAVYSNVYWEEGGHAYTEIKNGTVKHGAESLGWGAIGGSDVTANSKYVYFTTAKGNEGGGLSGADYPPKGKGWSGVLRCTKADIKVGAPFAGGKGTGNVPNSMLVVSEQSESINAAISGVCASETELFVACYDGKIRVYDANTMVYKREWTVTKPCQMSFDKEGMLWVVIGFNATKIERYNPNGTKLTQEINLTGGSQVGDFCIDKNNRMLIGDVGQNEQVLIYTNIGIAPELTSTFGDKQGIYSGVPGLMAPKKFHQIRGIGTDDAGNIYIGNTQWYTGGQGFILESYTPDGNLTWSRHCVMFVDGSDADDSNDAFDIYGPVEHFKVDYSKPAGTEATLSGYTVNRYKYPQDLRLFSAVSSVYVQYFNGEKFLISTTQNYSSLPICIFRFNPATDGEVAIPCIVWGSGKWNQNSPVGNWMWRDLNGNGQMDANEYTITNMVAEEYSGFGAYIDSEFSLWAAGARDVKKSVCAGLDANKIPIFLPYTSTPRPESLLSIDRIRYIPSTDVMYFKGTDRQGNIITRYSDWSKENRVSSYQIRPTDNFASFDVEGDYLFTALVRGDGKTSVNGQITVHNAALGTLIGKITPPATWGAGWNDMMECLKVSKRSNGEYVIIQEEDGRNKNVMYRWCPTGDCDQKSTCTTKLDRVVLSKNALSFDGLQTKSLTVSFLPDTICNKNIGWSSSNNNIVKVDQNGNVTSVNVGSAWIKAISAQQINISDSCLVTVTDVPVAGIKVSKDSLNLGISTNFQLNTTFVPVNALHRNLLWTSTASNIATVDSTGLVTALSEGNTFVIVSTTEGNFKDTCIVKSLPIPVDSIKIRTDSISTWVGVSMQLYTAIEPVDATNKNVSWKSLNNSIAKVDNTGKVTGIALGLTQIVVSTEDGNITDTCRIRIMSNNEFADFDIGNPGVKGSYTNNNGVITMTGSGDDIFNKSDQFNYACKPWVGDGQMIVKVNSAENIHGWTKAGLMFRESLAAGSKDVYTVMSPTFGSSIQWRDTTNSNSYYICPWDYLPIPYWLKLARLGNQFSAFKSANGIDWVKIGEKSVVMKDTVFVGLCLCSHIDWTAATAVFSNFSISSTVSNNLKPIVKITKPLLKPTVIQGQNLTFLAEASDPDGTISKLEFYVNDVLLKTSTKSIDSISYLPTTTNPIKFTAKAYDNEGDSTTVDKMVTVRLITGLNSLDMAYGITINAYPVPAGNVLNIEILSPKAVQSKLEILNIFGELILEKSCNLIDGKNHLVLETDLLNSGNYFLRLNGPDFKKVYKIIVQK